MEISSKPTDRGFAFIPSGAASPVLCELGLEIIRATGRVEWTPKEDRPGAMVLLSPPLSAEITVQREDGAAAIGLLVSADAPCSLNSLRLIFDFLPGQDWRKNPGLDDRIVPHVTPRRGHVMADQVFRSPALMARTGDTAIGLIPDLDLLSAHRPAPWMMELDERGPRGCPRLTLGMVHNRPDHHVYFKSEPHRPFAVPPEGIKLGAFLFLSTEAGRGFGRDLQRFLWERFGRKNYLAGKPQVLPLTELSGAALHRLFKRDDLYFEFEHQGKTVGLVTAHAATCEVPLKPWGPLGTKIVSPIHGAYIMTHLKLMNLLGLTVRTDDFTRRLIHRLGIPLIVEAWFQSWYNNLRTAYGTRGLAMRAGDQRLIEQADAIKELILSAPREDGIFPAVCTAPKGKVHWHKGTLAFKAISDYHTPDQATTAYIMLRWFTDLDPDPRLLETARGLARFFEKHQEETGTVPAWIDGRSHRHQDRLRHSASTAGPMMFLALFAKTAKDERALHSALRMARFIEREVIPRRKWWDYETFFSCSHQHKPARDPRTGALPANSMSMAWAAEGARILAGLTGEDWIRELHAAALEDLLWRQQVWDAPYISIDTFGGCSCMLSDAEWNDARQGMFAPIMMDSYLQTGDPHHFERGVAALRAAYTTMLHPAHKASAPGNMVYYRDSDYGAVYESYGHVGIDRVIAGYLEPDWGGGTAAFATAHAAQFYGDLFVDLPSSRAFGVNGIAVESMKVDGDTVIIGLTERVPGLGPLTAKIRGAGEKTGLMINGGEHAFERFEG